MWIKGPIRESLQCGWRLAVKSDWTNSLRHMSDQPSLRMQWRWIISSPLPWATAELAAGETSGSRSMLSTHSSGSFPHSWSGFFLASCATENGAPPPLLNPVIIREISPPSNQSEELEPGPRRLPEQHTHAAEPLTSCSACEARVWYSRHIVFWAIRSNFNSLFQSTGNKLFPVVRRRLSNNSRVTGSARWGEDELVAGYLHHYGGNVSYRLGNFRAAGGSCCFSIISDCGGGGGHVVSELTSRRLLLSYAASPLKRFFILRTCAGRMDAHFNWSDLELNRDAPSTNWDHLQ